jgi:hypothetical protein
MTGVIDIENKTKIPRKKSETNGKKADTTRYTNTVDSVNTKQFSMAGKSPEEVLPYLLSGESDYDDDFYDKLL